MLRDFRLSTLREFLIEQRDARRMSNEEFAAYLGIGKTTLYRYIKDHDPDIPERDTLRKIANATGYPETTLLELTNPELAERARSRTNAQLLAEMIEGLDETQRKFVMTLVETLLRKGDE